MSQRRPVRQRTISVAITAASCLLAGLLMPSGAGASAPPQASAQESAPQPQATESTVEIPDDTPDLPAVGHPARETTIEAESLAGRVVRDSSTAGVSTGGQQGPLGFSGDKRLVVAPAAEGEQATFRLAASAAGTYTLRLDVLTGPEHGRFTVAVNSDPVGDPVDSYADTTAVQRQLTIGQVQLTEGDNTLTIAGAGANAAATGTAISVDLVHLAPMTETTAIYPADGSVIKGTQRITIAGPHDGVSVDGTALGTTATEATLGSGSVSLVFSSSDFQGRSFPNYVEVGGVQIRVPNTARTTADESYTTTSVALPAALLTVGENTVRIAAGGSDANCGINFDDFRLRNVRLELPGGRSVAATGAADDVRVGDGSCGSNTSIEKSADFTFTLTEQQVTDPAGMAALLDTTTLADGPHTVVVDGAVGSDTQREFVVDNTAPVIESVSMDPDELLKGTKALTAEATDATTDVELIATVDGEPVTIGENLDSDTLSLGSHDLVITATDGANNVTARTIRFDAIPERPLLQGEGAPLDGASDVETNPVLRSTWRDPTREQLTVDFHEAGLASPTRATRGQLVDLPSGVRVPGVGRVGVKAVAEVDGKMLRSTKSSDSPVQTFDLPAQGNIDGLIEVRWDGTIDAAREAVLWAYDMTGGQWRRLAGARGSDDGSVITLRGTVSADFVDTRTPGRPVVHALVKGNDPFANDIADPADETFSDRSDYSFAMSWMTDTQYLSEGATKPGVENQQVFAETFTAMTNWIADNRRQRKIIYSAHTGDVIQTWSNGAAPDDPARRAQSRREYEFASDTMEILDRQKIANGVIPGNHDNLKGVSNDWFNEYFGADRYRALSNKTARPFYGGQYGESENDNSNHYDLFSRGGQDFIALYLGYGVNSGETEWANQVLDRYSDRNAIVLTHDYLRPSDKPDASDAEHTAEGQFIFDRVVSTNANVFLVLAGHTHGMGLNVLHDVSRKGHNVIEMLADRQAFEVDGERRGGFLRLLQFDLKRGEMSVNTYSPYLDNHNSIEFDTRPGREYQDTVDEFTVPIDINSRVTRFSTDAVRLAVEQPGLIGSTSVRTNEEATVSWTGLQPHTRYGWFTRATDSDTGVQVSAVFTFTTGTRKTPADATKAAVAAPAQRPVTITTRP